MYTPRQCGFHEYSTSLIKFHFFSLSVIEELDLIYILLSCGGGLFVSVNFDSALVFTDDLKRVMQCVVVINCASLM